MIIRYILKHNRNILPNGLLYICKLYFSSASCANKVHYSYYFAVLASVQTIVESVTYYFSSMYSLSIDYN